jgi:hypothetical protein
MNFIITVNFYFPNLSHFTLKFNLYFMCLIILSIKSTNSQLLTQLNQLNLFKVQ